MNRYLAAYFSPLRDPYFKDWLFYVYLVFTLPSVVGALSSNVGIQAIFPIIMTLIGNWIVFVFGAAWIRSFGTNKYSIGITEKYRPVIGADYPVLDQSGIKVQVNSLKQVGERLALKPSESMNIYDTNSPDFESSLEANFLWTILDLNSKVSSRFYGPIWFQSSELRAPVPATLTVAYSGELGISWRKHKNSLLDYSITHFSEIVSYRLSSESRLNIEVATVNRCIGQVSGLRNNENYVIELRLGRDGHSNRRSITAFYSLLRMLEGV